jgi:hypothetical protein
VAQLLPEFVDVERGCEAGVGREPGGLRGRQRCRDGGGTLIVSVDGEDILSGSHTRDGALARGIFAIQCPTRRSLVKSQGQESLRDRHTVSAMARIRAVTARIILASVSKECKGLVRTVCRLAELPNLIAGRQDAEITSSERRTLWYVELFRWPLCSWR